MSNGMNQFNWSDQQFADLNSTILDEVSNNRRARKVLPLSLLYVDRPNYVEGVTGLRVEGGDILQMRTPQTLSPVMLSSYFLLRPQQFTDKAAALHLATQAAYRVAFAEDAIVLYGHEARDELDRMHVRAEGLGEQRGLAGEGDEIERDSILDCILAGIGVLQGRLRFGDYCAIVAPDLYMEAYRPRYTPLDAPIYEIQPLLREKGFVSSPASRPRTGAIFSLGGASIDLAVAYDAHVEYDHEERGQAILRVVEQVCLRINDPDSVTRFRVRPEKRDEAKPRKSTETPA
jgi:uncharacterized linocin/CFP29 family protein